MGARQQIAAMETEFRLAERGEHGQDFLGLAIIFAKKAREAVIVAALVAVAAARKQWALEKWLGGAESFKQGQRQAIADGGKFLVLWKLGQELAEMRRRQRWLFLVMRLASLGQHHGGRLYLGWLPRSRPGCKTGSANEHGGKRNSFSHGDSLRLGFRHGCHAKVQGAKSIWAPTLDVLVHLLFGRWWASECSWPWLKLVRAPRLVIHDGDERPPLLQPRHKESRLVALLPQARDLDLQRGPPFDFQKLFLVHGVAGRGEEVHAGQSKDAEEHQNGE